LENLETVALVLGVIDLVLKVTRSFVALVNELKLKRPS